MRTLDIRSEANSNAMCLFYNCMHLFNGDSSWHNDKLFVLAVRIT